MTVPALPVILPVIGLVKVLVPEKVLLSARRVDEAAVMVPEAPRPMLVPLTVTDELVREEFGIDASESVPPEKLMPVAEETVPVVICLLPFA